MLGVRDSFPLLFVYNVFRAFVHLYTSFLTSAIQYNDICIGYLSVHWLISVVLLVT